MFFRYFHGGTSRRFGFWRVPDSAGMKRHAFDEGTQTGSFQCLPRSASSIYWHSFLEDVFTSSGGENAAPSASCNEQMAAFAAYNNVTISTRTVIPSPTFFWSQCTRPCGKGAVKEVLPITWTSDSVIRAGDLDTGSV